MKVNTESVKISSATLNKVRRHIKKSKHTIGGFIDLAAKEKLGESNEAYVSLEKAFEELLVEQFAISELRDLWRKKAGLKIKCED